MIPASHLSDHPLPPYTFVPGGPFPHPPHTTPDSPVVALDDWRTCEPYRVGIDLFNHGYYWEAHEAWESLWQAAGRSGIVATFLKGLIKLAAAELFEQVRRELGPDQTRFGGVDLAQLIEAARALTEQPPVCSAPRETPVVVVFGFALRPA